MLDAFKIKPYDLEPIYATWTDGPIFKGDPKKDPPVDEWLEKIKAGCVERKIPEECWYKVAQHFMGPKAKARQVGYHPRLNELKAVIAKVHGGKYRWTWKKFKVAMQSMGWGIDSNQTETIKISRQTGSWWTLRKKEEKEEPSAGAEVPHRPMPTRSESIFWGPRRGSIQDENEAPPPLPTRSDSSFWSTKKVAGEEVDASPAHRPRAPTRSGSDFWPKRRNSKDETEEPSSSKRPAPTKSISDTAVMTAAAGSSPKPPAPSRSNTVDSGSVTTVTQAPVWLLNACNALEYITSEHPKAMSIISAILITAGSIPAIPAIGAGAGGAILASGAAHAVGAIAVGLGQALSITVKNQQEQRPQAQVPSTAR